ncbi:MAG: TetR/AcrR family transcriptional regulator [Victivallales bacterium]|nr:TetR/AcrR family transcriptional regulator [Victivallales bacterium]MBO7535209.1 TetR/AcrR family transcriptional regulator [Victivallales bacterium]
MKQELTNRQKAAMETRKRLLIAARKLLYDKDFSEITVADIAKEAGVAVGSFYVYFKRKEDIVEGLEDYDFYHLAQIVNGMTEKGILDRLAYYCHEFMKGIEDYGLEITRQWIRNNVAPQRMCYSKEDDTKYTFDVRTLQSILQEGVTCGLLKPETPVDDLALFINAELYGLMLAWCMSNGAVVGSERTETLVRQGLAKIFEPYII